MKIIICGQPSSGNRVVEALLRAAGAQTEVVHTADGIYRAFDGGRDLAGYVVIVRSEPFWSRSVDSKPDRRTLIAQEAGSDRGDILTLMYQTIRPLVVLGLTGTVITYEALVRDPEAVCAHLWDTFGLPRQPRVPIVVFDANHHGVLEEPRPATKPAAAQMITPTGFKTFGSGPGHPS